MLNVSRLAEIDEFEDVNAIIDLTAEELRWIVENSASDEFSEVVYLEIIKRNEEVMAMELARLILKTKRDPILKVCIIEELFAMDHSKFLEIILSTLNNMSILEMLAVLDILLSNKKELDDNLQLKSLGESICLKLTTIQKSEEKLLDIIKGKINRSVELWIGYTDSLSN